MKLEHAWVLCLVLGLFFTVLYIINFDSAYRMPLPQTQDDMKTPPNWPTTEGHDKG